MAIASLALGVGANTAIFSFVNAILLKRLPVPEPERLVTFTETHVAETWDVVWRTRTIEELEKRNSAFDGLFGWFGKPVNFSLGDTGQWVMGELVTGQYFRTLELKPDGGRGNRAAGCVRKARELTACEAQARAKESVLGKGENLKWFDWLDSFRWELRGGKIYSDNPTEVTARIFRESC